MQSADDDVLIYHYAIEWPKGDEVYAAFQGRRILKYHNVTPPHLLMPYNKAIADACERGRKRLADLPPTDILTGDSQLNLDDYYSIAKQTPKRSAILPPFSQAQSLTAEVFDQTLFRSVQKKTRTAHRFLYVGKISPHKNVHSLIAQLDNVLTEADQNGFLFVAGSFARGFSKYSRLVRKTARHCKRLTVLFFEHTTNRQLSTLYRISHLFVTASLHEGFCVPVSEAMVFNLPMLLPDQPIFRETSKEQATFFQQITPHHLQSAMQSRLTNSAFSIFARHYSTDILRRQWINLLSSTD